MPVDDGAEFAEDRLIIARTRAARSGAKGGAIHEIVERHDGQDRVEHIRGRYAIGADDAAAMLVGRIVAIDDGNLVAMSHGAQGLEEFGREK